MTKNNKFNSSQDFRKSLETRLQNKAKKEGIDLQRLRRCVAFDRLLARLFTHPEPPFFLKGGYAMELRLSSARATKDIDITYLEKFKKNGELIPQLILDDLQRLAAIDLGDFFSYTLGTSQLDLENAPYGGARYPISSFIDGKLFVRFHLDVGGDILVLNTENLTTPDWLSFCDVPAPSIRMISIEQQLAEKIHTYTLPREEKQNSRVKDLIDILLLVQMRPLNQQQLISVLRQIFKVRDTHSLPTQLAPPPSDWTEPYAALAQECGINQDITIAFEHVSTTYSNLFRV